MKTIYRIIHSRTYVLDHGRMLIRDLTLSCGVLYIGHHNASLGRNRLNKKNVILALFTQGWFYHSCNQFVKQVSWLFI